MKNAPPCDKQFYYFNCLLQGEHIKAQEFLITSLSNEVNRQNLVGLNAPENLITSLSNEVKEAKT